MNIQLFNIAPAYSTTPQVHTKKSASYFTESTQNSKAQHTVSDKAAKNTSIPQQQQEKTQTALSQKPEKEINVYGHEITYDTFGNKIERDFLGNEIQRDMFGQEIKQNSLDDESKKTNADTEKETKKDIFGNEKCETCQERKYQDVSNDPSVSFQTPTALSPERAAAAVRGHEMEHVFHEQIKAKKEGREVVSQTVTYSTGICPECHRLYISGGQTRTVTKSRPEEFHIGLEEKNTQKGKYFDAVA